MKKKQKYFESVNLEKQICSTIRKVFYGWLQFQELGHWTTSSAIHSNTLEREKRGIQLLWQNYSIWDQQNLGERDRSFIVVQIKGIEENNILQNPDRGTITEIWKKYVKKPSKLLNILFSHRKIYVYLMIQHIIFNF